MKYKAVIFDLFGTLIKNFPWSESNNVLRRMAAELSVPPDDFTTLWHATFNDRMTGTLQRYQDCIRHICQQLGAQVENEKVELAAGMRLEMNQGEVSAPRDDAIEVLSHLKSNGHKTGLISDCSMETPTIWANSPLAALIDLPVFSCLVGLKKPDPRIFQMAVDGLSVSPRECIYVADGIGQELSGASKLGMYAVKIHISGEDEYDHYREDWNGPVISSLKEVLTLAE